MRIGISGPQDFIALLVRRKWWIIAPFLVLSSIFAVLIKDLPKTYVSTTLILVKPRDVPENMVVDLVSGSAEARLKAIEQILLSRANLVKIISQFGQKLSNSRRGNMDEQVENLRNDIKIQFQIEKSPNYRTESTINFFRISYQNRDPGLAQQVTKELLKSILDEDRNKKEIQISGTTDFLSGELVKVKALMDESGERLKAVKLGRQFELPENLQTNLKALDRLQLDKQGNEAAIDRSMTYRLNLDQQISLTPEFLIKVTAPPNAGRGPAAAPAPPKDPLLEAFLKAQDEYLKQATLNKETHPDVRQAKVRMERAKEKLPPEVLEALVKVPEADTPTPEVLSGAATGPNPANEEKVPNPAYEKLQADMRLLQNELVARRNEKAFIESQIAMYSRRVDATPQTELQIADVERENRDLQRRYEDLNSKLGQARLSESLESQLKGSQFFVQDDPNYPLDSAKPNKPAVLLGSCLLSLAFGLALAFTIDVARQRVRTQNEIEAIWGVPVLIDIPELVTDSDLAAVQKQKVRFRMYASMAVVLQVAFLYVVNLKHNGILDRLEPVLQKLVYR